MLILNETDSMNYKLVEINTSSESATTVVINPEYAELFQEVDVRTLFTVLGDYSNTGMTKIAPIACKSDFECGYDCESIISVERSCLLVVED